MKIIERVSLASYTTFQIGGPAEYLVEVETVAELQHALHYARDNDLSVLVLGGGSNVLIPDEGVSGLVIVNRIAGREVVESGETVAFTVGAGENFDDVVAHTVAHGWWGLENLSSIPGTVGATPIQNVGAYGVEIAEYVRTVEAVHMPTGDTRTFTNSECQFGYRDSWFKTASGREYVVTSVTYNLATTPQPTLSYKDLATYFSHSTSPTQRDIREAVIQIRSGKFPDWQKVGTAGSFFKNPIISTAQYNTLRAQYPELPSFPITHDRVKVPLGYVLDKICGLRGLEKQHVASYEGQALVLINTGGATANDVKAFAAEIAKTVQHNTNIHIEPEVQIL